MLMTEWNLDDALAVRFEEGIEEGMERGIEIGQETGMEAATVAIAKNALAKGVAPEFVQEITGLGMDVIKSIQTAL